MRAPAAAALLLAALTALPCRGTDAEVSRLPNATHNFNSQPLITKLYQMLHTSLNQSKPNFNTTIYSLNFYDLELNETFTNEISRDTLEVNKTFIDERSKDAETNLDFESDGKIRKRRVVSVRDVTTPSPMIMERRRKPGETGSSAPLLNYIFDTYSNTHTHHRNDKVGSGTGIYAAGALEIEALVGSTAHLDCKVDALHDKLVSWVRRKSDEDPMELLYTGTQQYTADDRYSSKFIPPDIWRLEVKEVRASDASHYDCQMPTHPPRAARVTLRVPEVSVLIVDGAGAKVAEQVCELGSTVALRCEVRGLKMEGGPSLLWYRKDDLLNDDTTRGGISVRTEFGANGANSVLRVARVRADDAGRYTCTVARAPPPGPPPAHVILHIIKGESLAELHQGGGTLPTSHPLVATLSLCVLLHNVILLLIY